MSRLEKYQTNSCWEYIRPTDLYLNISHRLSLAHMIVYLTFHINEFVMVLGTWMYCYFIHMIVCYVHTENKREFLVDLTIRTRIQLKQKIYFTITHTCIPWLIPDNLEIMYMHNMKDHSEYSFLATHQSHIFLWYDHCLLWIRS